MAHIPLFPLPKTVVFPGMTLPLYIFEARYKQMIKDCLANNQRRIAIVLHKKQADISDSPAIYSVGVLVDIMSIDENPDGSYNILTHAQSRCYVKDPDMHSHPYYSIELQDFALERTDPNLERLAAWDALEVFKNYARHFFEANVLKQLDAAIPEDLLYQASFICANASLLPEQKQALLESKTLVERFRLAQHLMSEQIALRQEQDIKDQLIDASTTHSSSDKEQSPYTEASKLLN